MAPTILQSWSGGKDSCLSLAELLRTDTESVAGLLTTVTEGYDRVSMHGVRAELLEAQARALALPLAVAYIPPSAGNELYETRMEAAFAPYRDRGVTTIAFGDLFLTDIRRYREAWLARAGMTPVFPLWERDTPELAREFIDRGFKAILTCVDTRVLAPAFAGRLYDRALLAELPPHVDPCGENGEFHTFVFEAPIFRHAIAIRRGETVQRDAWRFSDLLPALTSTGAAAAMPPGGSVSLKVVAGNGGT